MDVYREEEGRQLEEKAPADFSFQVPAAGRYQLQIEYKAPEGKPITPQGSLEILQNGAVIKETAVEFPRRWENAGGQPANGRFEQDWQGNELMPTQVEVIHWQTVTPSLGEDQGLNLAAGAYTLRLTMTRQPVRIRRLSLLPLSQTDDYAAYVRAMEAGGAVDTADREIRQEAELYAQKSHLEITLSYDRISASVSPNDPSKIRYNTLGGSGYSREGQWVSWNVQVPESGFYALDVVYRQNDTNGFSVRRRLTVDGEVPFRECETLVFPYAADFTCQTLADSQGTPYRFYLEKGVHELKLEVVMTGLNAVLQELSSIVEELNGLYSRIMVLVGETPDSYRDYDLDTHIDGLVPTLESCRQRLNALGARMDAGADSGIAGSGTSRIYETARMLAAMAKKVRGIPGQMDNFRSQINTLADLLGGIRSQPMELDYLTLRSPGDAPCAPGRHLPRTAALSLPGLSLLLHSGLRYRGRRGGAGRAPAGLGQHQRFDFHRLCHRPGSGPDTQPADHRQLHPLHRHPRYRVPGQRGGYPPARSGLG